MFFSELTPNAEAILREIIENRRENGTCILQHWDEKFSDITSVERYQLKSIFNELSNREMIRVLWSSKGPYQLILLNNGISYFDQKDEKIRREKEEKELADKQALRLQASTIVNGQPLIGGVRIMDESAEELLKIILNQFDGNTDGTVTGSMNIFPKGIAVSIGLEFEKLTMYGVAASSHVWIDGSWELYLTPHGIHYFEEKEKAVEENKRAIKQTSSVRKQYDVFISHASKDKSDYVEGLYMALRRLGITIFYDTDIVSWGDNWKQVILDGTAKSEFAIIVISENFFGREWTERELNEFLQHQNESGQKIVLPLLHNISIDQLKEHYPELEEIQVIDTSTKTKEDITILFAKELLKRYK